MPWKEISPMSQRITFLELYLRKEYSITDLANQFEISRKTAYKWIERHNNEGIEGLRELSRRPRQVSNITSMEKEIQILQCRERFPAWGARKLKKCNIPRISQKNGK